MAVAVNKNISPWVVAIVLGFCTVIGVNLWMLSLAVSSGKGEIESSPYERGMAFEQVITERKNLAARGWRLSPVMRYSREQHAQLVLTITDSTGVELRNVSIRAEIVRPSNKQYDRVCTLANVGDVGLSCELGELPAGLYLLTFHIDGVGRYDAQVHL